jgi:glycosyltransferase involved in cell wall biosynthesis
MNDKRTILVINSLGIEAKRYIDSIIYSIDSNFYFVLRPSDCHEGLPPNSIKAPYCRIFLGPILNFDKKMSEIKNLFLILLFPFLFIYNLTALFSHKRKKRLDKIILTNWNEKIILTAAANLLGIDIYWLELKCINKKGLSSGSAGFISWLYGINAKKARIISASDFISEQLINRGTDKKNIFLQRPAIKLNSVEHQENIFESMAKKDYLKKQRKFFTIGIICRLDENQRIETIFSAISSAIETIPNLQLIIVGEGREKKNLIWLSKKMHVENVVWFVGGQDRPKKWLDNFDIFVLPLIQTKIPDYYTVLEAMSAGLPVIAPKNFGLEDMVVENRTGILIDFDNPEMLSRLIIKLEQNINWRRDLGKNAKERIIADFTLEKMADNLNKIIN